MKTTQEFMTEGRIMKLSARFGANLCADTFEI
jgi:hypothetical protein